MAKEKKSSSKDTESVKLTKKDKKTQAEEETTKPHKDVPIKLKWFSWSGIKNEIKRIRWSSPKELFTDAGKVLVFCVLFGVFFVLCDLVVGRLLLWIGIGA